MSVRFPHAYRRERELYTPNSYHFDFHTFHVFTLLIIIIVICICLRFKMSTATTTSLSPSSVRKIWVQIKGYTKMRFTIEPHMKIIDDLTEALFGYNRYLYRTEFRGQVLSPCAAIPDDITDEDLLELKPYKSARRKYSMRFYHQINR